MSALPFLVVFGGILLVVVIVLRAVMKPGARRTGGPGIGATGAVYDMLNEEKRKAIEIIVEGRAEYSDPETADDVPPEKGRSG